MDENMTSVMEEIEVTMACTAFAEAGEPCPLDKDLQEGEKKKSILKRLKRLWLALPLTGQESPAR